MSPRPAAPGTWSLGAALDQSAPLTQLLLRLRASRALFDTVRPLLPPALIEDVRPGPLEGEAWSLLATNGAVAAKLRQLLPSLLEAVRGGTWQITSIRVRVQPRGLTNGT